MPPSLPPAKFTHLRAFSKHLKGKKKPSNHLCRDHLPGFPGCLTCGLLWGRWEGRKSKLKYTCGLIHLGILPTGTT